jgi:hypothetical protein
MIWLGIVIGVIVGFPARFFTFIFLMRGANF